MPKTLMWTVQVGVYVRTTGLAELGKFALR